MSGNRANASAVQRRTNNPPPVRSSSTSSSSRYAPPPPPQTNPKLSVSDAIALITIRLGRVETFINQLPPLDQLESFSSSQTEEPANNMSLVNDNVFQSIVTRLERLEKSKNSDLEQHISLSQKENAGNVQKILSLEQLVSSLEQKITLLQNRNYEPTTVDTTIIDDKITSLNTQIDQLKDTTIIDDKITSLNTQIDQLKDTTIIDDKITSLNTQIDQLKDTVLSLQTYTMNTNTKLIDLIITNTEMNENQEENEDITKHLENLFRNNFENFETEENNSDLFEETLNEEQTSEDSPFENKLTLSEDDLSNLSINI
jgi:hypothetical protein